MQVPFLTSSGIMSSIVKGSESKICISVPPVSFFRNQERSEVWCPPGFAQRQPFSIVASSNANQNPMHDEGSVYKNVASW